MITTKVLRGFSVLAIVLSGFISGTAFAAPSAGVTASAPAAACQLLAPLPDNSFLTQMTGTYLPGLSGSPCPSADTSASAATTGVDLPSVSGGGCPTLDASKLAEMTGTYLPNLSGSLCS